MEQEFVTFFAGVQFPKEKSTDAIINKIKVYRFICRYLMISLRSLCKSLRFLGLFYQKQQDNHFNANRIFFNTAIFSGERIANFFKSIFALSTLYFSKIRPEP